MQKIAIQGAGFVGSAFSIACASAKRNNRFIFNVSIIEKENQKNLIDKINKGIFPFETDDKKLSKLIKTHINKNLFCSTSINEYKKANVIVSCIGFDCNLTKESFKKNRDEFLKNIKEIARNMQRNCLLIIQTTLPPGFTNSYIKPVIEEEFKKRKISTKNLLLAHSFERVMPGSNYFNSIVNNWRICGAINKKTIKKSHNFFSKFINLKKYPIKYFDDPIYSETAKILENTYRAVNISFIDEWSRFAENIDVNLYDIINTIKVRPTHNNLMFPGFGVGGYCLTKDPKFIDASSKFIFNNQKLKFPHTKSALLINKKMPNTIFQKMSNYFSNNLKNKKILILGVSYKDGVADTRKTPTEKLYLSLKKSGSIVDLQDPLVKYWSEQKIKISKKIPEFNNYDAIVFATNHKQYSKINLKKKILQRKILIVDAINLIKDKFRTNFKKNIKLITIGK